MDILLVSDDLMGATRIAEGLKKGGNRVLGKRDLPLDSPPDLIAVDLRNRDALETIKAWRRENPDIRLVAFGPHVDGAQFRAAKEAGANEMVANSAVVERILKRGGAVSDGG